MNVGASIDVIRLNWVREEIESSLRDAGVALESYVEDQGNKSQLKVCNARLHEVSGALRMLELGGPGILSLEMENMAASLARGDIAEHDQAVDALSRAILQLPDQLERLQAGQLDVPLSLLPMINELRTLRGEKPLEEFALFKPDLTVFMPVQRREGSEEPAEDAQQAAQRLRPIYQKSLVTWYRNPGALEHLQRLGAVLLRLSEVSQRYASIQLWWVGSGLVQALGEGSLQDPVRARQLLGQLDQQIKNLAASGEGPLADHPPERLVREMLYLLARADSQADQVNEIRATFQLEALFPKVEDERRAVGPNLELLRTVSDALMEDLAKAKDVLDIFVAGNKSDPRELSPLIEGLGKISDILAMVNLESSRQAIDAEVETVREMVAGSRPCDRDQLMDLAGVLLKVENTLHEMAAGHIATSAEGADASASDNAQFEEALAGVVREAVTDMGLVKDAIVAYLANPREKRVLEVTPRYFERVSGCMKMLSHERAAQVAERIGEYIIEGLLNSESVPPRETLEYLADAITGLEYFVESTHEQRPNALQQLEMAAERLRDLGFPVEQLSEFEQYSSELDIDLEAQFAETQVGAEQNGAEVGESTGIDFEVAPPEDQADRPSAEIIEFEPVVGEDADTEEILPPESGAAPEETAIDSQPETGGAEAGSADSQTPDQGGVEMAEPTPAQEVTPGTPPTMEAAPAAEETVDLPPVLAPDADPETVEIFIEEAEEIRDAVAENYALWRQNQNDEAVLTELRRSFHTLKGSGRLVGAMRIGELAWAVENMLNRLLDHTIKNSNALVDLLDQVVETIPALVTELQGGESVPPDRVLSLIEGAEFLALSPERQEALLAGSPAVESVRTPETAEPIEEESSGVAATGEPEAEAEVVEVSEADAAQPEEAEGGGGMDPVLYEIFSQETEGHIAAIEAFVENCHESGDHCRVNDQLLRALHTLHGSARMAGVSSIAEISGALERYAKMLHKNQGEFVPETLDILPDSVAMIREIFAHLNDASHPLPETEPLLERIRVLDAKEQTTQIMRIEGDLAEQLGIAHEEETETPRDRVAAFLEKAADILDAAEVTLRQWQEAPQTGRFPAELRDALQTLEGGARAVELTPLADLAAAVVSLLTPEPEAEPGDFATIELTQRCVDRLVEMLNQVAQVGSVTAPDDLVAEINALVELRSSQPEATGSEPAMETGSADRPFAAPGDVTLVGEEAPEAEQATPEEESGHEFDLTPTMAFNQAELEASWSESAGLEDTAYPDDDAMGELVDIFLEEAEEILDNTENTLEHWNNNPANHGLVGELERQLHTLKGGARMAELTSVADLSHTMETLLKAVIDGKVEVSRDLFDALHQSVDTLVGMIEKIRHGSTPDPVQPLIDMLDSLATGRDRRVTDSTVMQMPVDVAAQLAAAEAEAEAETETEVEAEAEETVVGEAVAGEEAVTEIGMEGIVPAEPEETAYRPASLAEAGAEFADTLSEEVIPAEESPTEAGIGDVSGEAETIPEPSPMAPEFPSEDAAVAEPSATAPETQAGDDAFEEVEAITEGVEAEPEEPTPTVAEEVAEETPLSVDLDEGIGEEDRRQAPRVQHETIRVRSDLIDDLVNYAGEVGIYRSRLEQQTTTFRANLSELEQTVARLNQQLRNLEIETEAQILYRYEKEGESSKEEFDPLELDRFSTMQQLSRALAESVNDLNNLREMLANLNRESETLLLQQSRVANTLQEGLMRSRMVQFGGLMPRMRRIVRQACQEAGKWAKLRVEGAGVEMDTTVIDRMLPALEHILRNAVAHGIEKPEVRRGLGKDETGVIQLDLSRDGPDVVIHVRDDGAGINVEAIRRKAVERGMLRPDAQLKNEDLVQLILESGISTAENVTQLAGRGVGMDVVASEIKQLGGSLQIETEEGKGTLFTLRLPFTLAVNRALLVQVGDELYAIPLSNVVGIVRVSEEEVRRFQEGEQTEYDYAGGKYTYRHLGSLLGGKVAPPAGETRIPLLMVRAGENYTALHADAVLGSRDVVVKSLGRQMSAVRGLLGATILADGRVVLILDIGALVHRGVVMDAAEQVEEEPVDEKGGPPLVMVVDDSITIRKVTSRLLERHNMRSITAKDGVDALAVMQETIPDVMLLDIEMPRMDGYDLAAHMRADDRLKHIPIVMITSRTGDKHRQRAMDLGVDHYLGKPYQERELVDTINQMLEKSRSATRH
ncbi:MAG: hypothetical protein Kow006_03730 [Gammaproteobacteria bacterium]